MKLTFNNDKLMIDKILRYCEHLSSCKNLLYHSNIKRPHYPPIYHFKVGMGKTEILYHKIYIIVDYSITDEIVGNAAKAVKYHTLILTTKTAAHKSFFCDFLKDANDFCDIKKEKTEIISYIFKTGYWQQLSKLPKRDTSTLHLPDSILQETLDDLQKFLNDKDKYLQYGIPYKRNYLFEGLPGTGKTSLIFVLASYFDMNIAIINFGLTIDDATFMKSVSKLPDDCLLVLEDIDALFVERKLGDSHKSMVSFSGILNTLDGLARRDKQITFLTTNYISKLDSALIRPGRIDKIITFSHSTLEQIHQFFLKFIPNQEKKWETFKKKIRYLKTTAAILQSFFFKYMDCDNILDHIDDLLKISKEKKNIICENMYL